MTTKATTPDIGEVVIGGTFFPLVENGHRPGTVQALDITVRPQKRLEGDITRTSNPNLSNIAFSDFRSGIGLDVMEGNETDRCWVSNCNIRYKRSLTLGPLLQQTATDAGFSDAPGGIGERAGTMYVDVTGGGVVFTYNVSADSWASEHTGGASASRSIVSGTIGSTEFIVVAGGTGYAAYNGSSWTDSTHDSDWTVFHDGRMWGIDDADGQLFYTYTPGTVEVDVAVFPKNAGLVVGMFLYRNIANIPAIYVLGQRGLYLYDQGNDSFLEVPFPQLASFIKTGYTIWRDNLYISSGHAMFEYNVSGSGVVIRNVGLDLDDGLELIGAATTESSLHLQNLRAFRDEIIATATFELNSAPNEGVSTPFLWDGRGWYEVPGASSRYMDGLHVSNINNVTRAYFDGTTTDALGFIELPQTTRNPKKDPTYDYAPSGILKTSWFHADQVDVDKLAVRLKVETSDTSTSGTVESVKIEYAIDYNEGSSDANYLTLANSTFTDGLIDTDTAGVTQTTFVFPLDTADLTVAPVGKTFRAIRFKVSLARGGTTTNSPRLISMTLEYRKKYETKKGYQFVINMAKDRHKGNTAAKLRAALQTLVESNTMSEFTFRDDSGGTRNIYVDVRIPSASEVTGHLESGQTLVEVKEL